MEKTQTSRFEKSCLILVQCKWLPNELGSLLVRYGVSLRFYCHMQVQPPITIVVSKVLEE